MKNCKKVKNCAEDLKGVGLNLIGRQKLGFHLTENAVTLLLRAATQVRITKVEIKRLNRAGIKAMPARLV